MSSIKNKFFSYCLAIALFPVSAIAQEMGTPLSSTPEPFKNSFAAGVKVGLIGPGLDFSMSVSKKLNVRLTGNYMKLNMKSVKDFSDVKVEFKTTVTVGAVGLIADWHPFESAPIIKISGGVMYNFNKATIVGKTTESYSFDEGNYVFTPDDIGALSVEFKVNPIAPYLGFGFGNVIPKHKWGFNIELGTLYHGSPKVELTTSNPDTDLIAPTAGAENQEQIESNVKNYYLYPILSFQLNYKIK